MTPTSAWGPDILGRGFQQRTLPLAPDDEGDVVATLVRSLPSRSTLVSAPRDAMTDVLYIHGWSDYFFQRELAAYWTARGARFFALDLRKYGRSLRDGQTPGYAASLDIYDEDIAAALAVIRHRNPGRSLILLGHSTGGLTLSLWCARHPGEADALILNSPWLEFQAGATARTVIGRAMELHVRMRDPKTPLPVVDPGFYTRSVSRQFDGEWDYNLAWRPEHGFPLHPGWLDAIFAGQQVTARGLDIDVPVLALLSARSNLSPVWSEAMFTADVALDVNGVAARALDLGTTVTIARINDALHDVFLSRQPARERAYQAMSRWMDGFGPAASTGTSQSASVAI